MEPESFKARALPGALASLPAVGSHQGPRLRIDFYAPRLDMVCTQTVGHMDLAGAIALVEVLERASARTRPLRVFHDWYEMSGYDSDARVRLTRWTVDNRDAVARVDVLVRSKLVAMGVATANLATSPLGVHFHSHTERASYDAALVAATRA